MKKADKFTKAHYNVKFLPSPVEGWFDVEGLCSYDEIMSIARTLYSRSERCFCVHAVSVIDCTTLVIDGSTIEDGSYPVREGRKMEPGMYLQRRRD